MTFLREHAEAVAMVAHIMRRADVARAERPIIHVRDVKCGRWINRANGIVLPLWLFSRTEPGYFEWYVGHELAHWLIDRPGHDVQFQLMLAWLCPDAWHWESTYKPRMYSQALTLLSS